MHEALREVTELLFKLVSIFINSLVSTTDNLTLLESAAKEVRNSYPTSHYSCETKHATGKADVLKMTSERVRVRHACCMLLRNRRSKDGHPEINSVRVRQCLITFMR